MAPPPTTPTTTITTAMLLLLLQRSLWKRQATTTTITTTARPPIRQLSFDETTIHKPNVPRKKLVVDTTHVQSSLVGNHGKGVPADRSRFCVFVVPPERYEQYCPPKSRRGSQ